MSDATLTQSSGGGPPKISNISEAVIRIAGNSQDGIQAIGGFLARLAGRSEQEVMTFMTIPSTISGGPSIFQVRIGSGEVLSAGDDADVLLAFYQHSYEDHINSLKKGGIVLYDSDHVEPKPEFQKDYHHLGIPISGLTVEAIGGTAKDKGKNIFALGLVAKMFDLNVPKLEKLIGERFSGKDTSILNNALAAFHAGYSHSLGNVLDTFKFVDSQHKEGQQVVMNGNEALAYGLIAAGVRFGAGYPITPWSDVMEILRRELPKYGGTFVQCEDEIASISMALGAGLALAGLWVLLVGGTTVTDRLLTFHTEAHTELSTGLRLTVTKDCARMFVDKPLLGFGLGTFPTAYPPYQSFYTNIFVNEAHNDYAQLLVEMGLAGFGVMVWLLVLLFRTAWRKLKSGKLGVNGGLALAGSVGCVGILVHSFFDFNMQVASNAAWFYALAAMVAAPSVSEPRAKVSSQRREVRL